MPDFNMNVTSADIQLVLTCEELYPNGVQLQGFSPDASLDPQTIEYTETRRGIDGKMVAGVVKNITNVNLTLEASSPSRSVMETIRDAMKANNKPYEITLTATYPALGITRNFVRGVLKSGLAMPSAQKTLQPTQWTFDFEDVR